MSDLTIVIPAAGASSRMRGTDKLLTLIDGVALLRRTAVLALTAHPSVMITLRDPDIRWCKTWPCRLSQSPMPLRAYPLRCAGRRRKPLVG